MDPASVVTRLTQAGYVPDPDESFVLRWVDPARPLEIRVAALPDGGVPAGSSPLRPPWPLSRAGRM